MIPRLGRLAGEGKGSTLQYPGLENSMDCVVHGVAKSQTQLSDFTILSSWSCLLRLGELFAPGSVKMWGDSWGL